MEICRQNGRSDPATLKLIEHYKQNIIFASIMMSWLCLRLVSIFFFFQFIYSVRATALHSVRSSILHVLCGFIFRWVRWMKTERIASVD